MREIASRESNVRLRRLVLATEGQSYRLGNICDGETMDQQTLYKNETEMRQHQAAISHLVQDLHASEVGVKPLYELVLARFNRTARIREYLSVLVSRRVNALMRAHMTERNPPVSDFEGRRHGSADL
jgi:hypothetical protein